MLSSAFISGQSVVQKPQLRSTAFAVHAEATRISRGRLLVENRVVIRFQRYGRKNVPFYRIVAIDSKDKRDGRPVQRLGWYNPLSKETNLDAPAIKRWLSVGAKPSAAAARVLRRAMVIDPETAEEFLA